MSKKGRKEKLRLEQKLRKEKRRMEHLGSGENHLGPKELEKYRFMYDSLNGQSDNFPHPDKNPTSDDYKKIRVVYHQGYNLST